MAKMFGIVRELWRTKGILFWGALLALCVCGSVAGEIITGKMKLVEMRQLFQWTPDSDYYD